MNKGEIITRERSSLPPPLSSPLHSKSTWFIGVKLSGSEAENEEGRIGGSNRMGSNLFPQLPDPSLQIIVFGCFPDDTYKTGF